MIPAPENQPPRDGLAHVFFVIHIGVVLYTLVGWAIRPGLIAYLVFVPVMVLHWPLNGGACILNNLETLIRTGRWRDQSNREEGAWLHCLIVDVTGFGFSQRTVDWVTYGVLTGLWLLGLWHWIGWPFF